MGICHYFRVVGRTLPGRCQLEHDEILRITNSSLIAMELEAFSERTRVAVERLRAHGILCQRPDLQVSSQTSSEASSPIQSAGQASRE